MTTQPDVYFVTGNPKKLEEVQNWLSQHKCPLEIQNIKLDLPELQGEGNLTLVLL
jgi:hypothetical protein